MNLPELTGKHLQIINGMSFFEQVYVEDSIPKQIRKLDKARIFKFINGGLSKTHLSISKCVTLSIFCSNL